MQIIDYKDRPLESVFALIYGDSGSGKTHLAATLGELGRVLIVDIDKGSRTIQCAEDLKQYHDNIVIADFALFKDLDNLYKLTSANTKESWTRAFNVETEPFDWVVIDTWTELQWYMLQELRKREGLGGSALDFRKNIGIQHWGALTDLNKLSVEAFKGLKAPNIVFIMQEAVVQDAATGMMIKGPAIHGKLVKEMPAYFEIVIHTYTDVQGKWHATTLPKAGWPAKTRLGAGQDLVAPLASQIFTIAD